MKAPRRIQMDSALARVGHLKRLMSGYVHRGGDPGRLRSLADVIGHDIVTEGLRFHLERAGGEPNTHHAQIVIAVLAVARQWVGVSEDHLTGLKRLQKTFRLPRPGMAEETRKLLRRYDDPVLLGLLLNRPAEVIRSVTAKAHIAPADAARAAAALGVVMLLECPVRPKNMASVDFDKNIMRTEHKRQPSVTLSFGADEIKNDVDLLMPLSSEAVALLDLYLQHIRPVLVQTDCSYLFPARDGGHLAPAYFSDRIARFMLAEVGVRMTAHKFRHLAGYLFLKQNPGQHEVVRCLLGHKDIATTVTYYAPIEQDEAFRHYDDLIGGLRKASLAKPKRRKR